MISRYIRHHTQSATAGIALGLIGLILIYNGTLDVPDLEQPDRTWLIVTCLVGGSFSLVLSGLCFSRTFATPRSLEAAMAGGLVAAIVANFVTGFLWPDSLWITCGYTMTLAVAAGLTLRKPLVFAAITLLLLAAWLVAVNTHVSEFSFRGDATTLVVIGTFVSVGVFWILRNEREGQASLTRQLRTQLDYDALTGALNRTGLMSGVEVLRANADLRGDGRVWCAYVDVNYFKSINDRRGHDYGDDVLRAVARGLLGVCGEVGLVSRWGGDEFVVMSGGDPPSEASIESTVGENLQSLKLQASVTAGVASAEWRNNPQPETMIDRADLRMYRRRSEVRTGAPDRSGSRAESESTPPST